jgi:hypothetical protein
MNPKLSLIAVPVAALVCFAFAQAPQNPQNNGQAQRIESLEREVAALKEAQKMMRMECDQIGSLMRAQATSADALLAVLDDSEQKGFTYGINPDSRIVLLAGLRQFLADMQRNVPPAAVAPVKATNGTSTTTKTSTAPAKK